MGEGRLAPYSQARRRVFTPMLDLNNSLSAGGRNRTAVTVGCQPTAHGIIVLCAFQAVGRESSLRSIACVDTDIVVGEVGCPHMGLGAALSQLD